MLSAGGVGGVIRYLQSGLFPYRQIQQAKALVQATWGSLGYAFELARASLHVQGIFVAVVHTKKRMGIRWSQTEYTL